MLEFDEPEGPGLDLLADTWRGVVEEHLRSRDWWGHVSAFSAWPPHLYLRPDAPAEIESTLADLVAQGLAVERAVVTFEWLADEG